MIVDVERIPFQKNHYPNWNWMCLRGAVLLGESEYPADCCILRDPVDC